MGKANKEEISTLQAFANCYAPGERLQRWRPVLLLVPRVVASSNPGLEFANSVGVQHQDMPFWKTAPLEDILKFVQSLGT